MLGHMQSNGLLQIISLDGVPLYLGEVKRWPDPLTVRFQSDVTRVYQVNGLVVPNARCPKYEEYYNRAVNPLVFSAEHC